MRFSTYCPFFEYITFALIPLIFPSFPESALIRSAGASTITLMMFTCFFSYGSPILPII